MAASHKGNSKRVPVTSADEIRRVAGSINDETVAAILRVGPTFEELEAATRYALGEGDEADCAGHPLAGRVAQLYEILSAEEADEDEARAAR